MKTTLLPLGVLAPALDVAAQEVERSAPAPASDALTNLGSMLGGLVLVIALIFLLAWAARRFSWTKMLAHRTEGPIRLVGTLSLGTRERLVLVDVEGRRVLLGVVPGEISRLDISTAEAGSDFESRLSEAGGHR
jgi:flagellar protein FliO/FliZ